MEITLERFSSRAVAGYVVAAATLVTQEAMTQLALKVAETVGSPIDDSEARELGGLLGFMPFLLVATCWGFGRFSTSGAGAALLLRSRVFSPGSSLFFISVLSGAIAGILDRPYKKEARPDQE